MYIVWSTTCSECGGDTAIKKFNNEPTLKEISEVEDAIGRSVCITTYIQEFKDDYEDEIFIKKDNL